MSDWRQYRNVYKVLAKGPGGNLLSVGFFLGMIDAFARAVKEYPVDRWTYPVFPNSLLFTFATIEDARKFRNETLLSVPALNPEEYLTIYCGEVTATDAHLIFYVAHPSSAELYWEHWEQHTGHRQIAYKEGMGFSSIPAPAGTIGVSALRLLYEVKEP